MLKKVKYVVKNWKVKKLWVKVKISDITKPEEEKHKIVKVEEMQQQLKEEKHQPVIVKFSTEYWRNVILEDEYRISRICNIAHGYSYYD